MSASTPRAPWRRRRPASAPGRPKKGCYIHAGLSSTGPVSIRGPEAKAYLQGLLINSLEKFPVGSMKHAVMGNEDGLIVAHGIIERKGEDHFE